MAGETRLTAAGGRVSDDAGFMCLGELLEFGETGQIFTRPRDEEAEDYITGKYG